MNPTKQELEQIWQTGPIGWLSKTGKKNKGKTAYVVTATPYTKQYLDPVSITVYAKSKKNVETYGINQLLKETYPEQFLTKEFGWTVSVTEPKT